MITHSYRSHRPKKLTTSLMSSSREECHCATGITHKAKLTRSRACAPACFEFDIPEPESVIDIPRPFCVSHIKKILSTLYYFHLSFSSPSVCYKSLSLFFFFLHAQNAHRHDMAMCSSRVYTWLKLGYGFLTPPKKYAIVVVFLSFDFTIKPSSNSS